MVLAAPLEGERDIVLDASRELGKPLTVLIVWVESALRIAHSRAARGHAARGPHARSVVGPTAVVRPKFPTRLDTVVHWAHLDAAGQVQVLLGQIQVRLGQIQAIVAEGLRCPESIESAWWGPSGCRRCTRPGCSGARSSGDRLDRASCTPARSRELPDRKTASRRQPTNAWPVERRRDRERILGKAIVEGSSVGAAEWTLGVDSCRASTPPEVRSSPTPLTGSKGTTYRERGRGRRSREEAFGHPRGRPRVDFIGDGHGPPMSISAPAEHPVAVPAARPGRRRSRRTRPDPAAEGSSRCHLYPLPLRPRGSVGAKFNSARLNDETRRVQTGKGLREADFGAQ